MFFQVAKNRIQALADRSYFFLMTTVVLLMSNLLLILLLVATLSHEKRTVIPVSLNQAVTVSDVAIDSNYLSEMGLFFTQARLDVTPETVIKDHRLLLQYTDSHFYHAFQKVLQEEETAIEKQKISSAFYPDEIIPDSRHLKLLVKGTLHRWVANVALEPIKKVYQISFSYRFGLLKIKDFSESGDIHE